MLQELPELQCIHDWRQAKGLIFEIVENFFIASYVDL
jgi:hypothetical protein